MRTAKKLAAEPTKFNVDDYIETFKGTKFYLHDPKFDIEEISHALSNVCRFSGHCARRYSVAEHSVLVSLIMEDQRLGNPYEGLMHDATEAYLGDIASPWKKLLPDYKAIEHALETKMRAHFGLEPTMSAGCKLADWTALILEARLLIKSGATDWLVPAEPLALATKIADDYHIMCWDPESARREFMGRYRKVAP